MPSVKTSVTELPESRVRVQAEVPADEVERRVTEAARRARPPAARARLPQGQGPAAGRDPAARPRGGARRGAAQAPRQLVRRRDRGSRDRAGRRARARRRRAAGRGRAAVVLDRDRRPSASRSSGDTRASRSAAASREVPEARIDEELERLREQVATLETVDRPAAEGDYVVIDYTGTIDGEPFEGGEWPRPARRARRGTADPRLRGAAARARRAGEERTVEVTFPDDYGRPSWPGRTAQFDVTVGEVKAKLLPELDDEFAVERRRVRHARRAARGHRGRACSRPTSARSSASSSRQCSTRRSQRRRSTCRRSWSTRARTSCSRSALGALARQGITKEAYLQDRRQGRGDARARGRARGRAGAASARR